MELCCNPACGTDPQTSAPTPQGEVPVPLRESRVGAEKACLRLCSNTCSIDNSGNEVRVPCTFGLQLLHWKLLLRTHVSTAC